MSEVFPPDPDSRPDDSDSAPNAQHGARDDRVVLEGASRDEDGHLQYLLTAYLFENISAEGKAEVESHLESCGECRAELEELRTTLTLIEGPLHVDEIPKETVPYSFEGRRLQRVLAAGHKRAAGRRWNGRLFRTQISRRQGLIAACLIFALILFSQIMVPTVSMSPEQAARIQARNEALYKSTDSEPSASPIRDMYARDAVRQSATWQAEERERRGRGSLSRKAPAESAPDAEVAHSAPTLGEMPAAAARPSKPGQPSPARGHANVLRRMQTPTKESYANDDIDFDSGDDVAGLESLEDSLSTARESISPRESARRAYGDIMGESRSKIDLENGSLPPRKNTKREMKRKPKILEPEDRKTVFKLKPEQIVSRVRQDSKTVLTNKNLSAELSDHTKANQDSFGLGGGSAGAFGGAPEESVELAYRGLAPGGGGGGAGGGANPSRVQPSSPGEFGSPSVKLVQGESPQQSLGRDPVILGGLVQPTEPQAGQDDTWSYGIAYDVGGVGVVGDGHDSNIYATGGGDGSTRNSLTMFVEPATGDKVGLIAGYEGEMQQASRSEPADKAGAEGDAAGVPLNGFDRFSFANPSEVQGDNGNFVAGYEADFQQTPIDGQRVPPPVADVDPRDEAAMGRTTTFYSLPPLDPNDSRAEEFRSRNLGAGQEQQRASGEHFAQRPEKSKEQPHYAWSLGLPGDGSPRLSPQADPLETPSASQNLARGGSAIPWDQPFRFPISDAELAEFHKRANGSLADRAGDNVVPGVESRFADLQDNFVENLEVEGLFGDASGVLLNESLVAGSTLYDSLSQIPGEDGTLNTPDDRVVITGGGDAWVGADGEPAGTSSLVFVPAGPNDDNEVVRRMFEGVRDGDVRTTLQRGEIVITDGADERHFTSMDNAELFDQRVGTPASKAKQPNQPTVPRIQLLAPDAERRIRAYSHYRKLDPSLTRDAFRAHPLEIPAPAVGDEGLGRDGFRERYGLNPFVDTRVDHFSTFAMDVDTASYVRARAMLQGGALPDPNAVRVEEFVNAFREELKADPDHAFAVACEGGPSAFGPDVEILKVTVKARELVERERRNAVLTFAVDTSGSMFIERRLAMVKVALKRLLGALNEDDKVAIVAYGSQAYLALPHTPAREQARILGALDSLIPGGSTNVESGLDLAYRIADESYHPKALHRVVLCSDGVATAGQRGADEILAKVRVFARRGIYLSVVGFGRSRYDDNFLESLANGGNGNYSYVDSARDAEEVFARNLPGALEVLARDAKIQVDFSPEVVSHYRLLGYENRDIADKDFRNDKVDAGEVGPGSTVTALYEIRRHPGSHGDLGRVFVRYFDTTLGRVEELDFGIRPGVLVTDARDQSDALRFRACVAEFAELLRGSYWARDGAYAEVFQELNLVSPEFRARPEWLEVVSLVAQAQDLSLRDLLNR